MGEDPVMDGVTIVLGENITEMEVVDETTGKVLREGEYRLFTESVSGNEYRYFLRLPFNMDRSTTYEIKINGKYNIRFGYYYSWL